MSCQRMMPIARRIWKVQLRIEKVRLQTRIHKGVPPATLGLAPAVSSTSE